MEKEINICPKCGFIHLTDVCPKCNTPQSNFSKLSSITTAEIKRKKLSIDSLNTLFGGGVVMPSAILISGAPGSGKSTLLLQIAHDFCHESRVLYFSLEEDMSGVKKRSERLSLLVDDMLISQECRIQSVISQINCSSADVIIIDSLQMLEDGKKVYSSPQLGKKIIDMLIKNCPDKTFFIISQQTKDGKISGSRVVEHLVDVVLRLDVQNDKNRALYCTKNRFASCDIVCQLTMSEKGLFDKKVVYGRNF